MDGRILLVLLMIAAAPVDISARRAKSEEGEIIVQLATESRLLPIYVAKIQATDSQFPEEYGKHLEKVLQFDLGHNGVTTVIDQNSRREALIEKRKFEEIDLAEDWKKEQAFYLVKVKVEGILLSARVVSLANGTVKGIDSLQLTGNLNSDRTVIHELSNSIQELLFGTTGVATTHFLYTVRHPNPSKNGPEWVSEVWEADYDGYNARQVTQEGHYCLSPTYLPPRSGYASGSFFYVSYRTGQPKIFVGSTTEVSSNRLSYLRGNQMMPAVSPQRDQIAFISDVTGNPDLFVLPFSPESGATDKPYQIFSAARGTQASPVFSPDGKQVAFVSNKDGSPRIYLLDIPGPGSPLSDINALLISKANRESTSPAWAPDGSRLAYSAKTDGVRQIWVYDFASGQEQPLTRGPGHKENPTWAPDSLHLIFNSADVDSSELYLVNLHQPGATKISSGPGEKRFPSWEHSAASL